MYVLIAVSRFDRWDYRDTEPRAEKSMKGCWQSLQRRERVNDSMKKRIAAFIKNNAEYWFSDNPACTLVILGFTFIALGYFGREGWVIAGCLWLLIGLWKLGAIKNKRCGELEIIDGYAVNEKTGIIKGCGTDKYHLPEVEQYREIVVALMKRKAVKTPLGG